MKIQSRIHDVEISTILYETQDDTRWIKNERWKKLKKVEKKDENVKIETKIKSLKLCKI